jgi:hypothetical protein
VPYAGSYGAFQDPTHIHPGYNRATFTYYCPFDKDGQPNNLYNVYQPKPWKIVQEDIAEGFHCNMIMEPLKRTSGGVVRLKVA